MTGKWCVQQQGWHELEHAVNNIKTQRFCNDKLLFEQFCPTCVYSEENLLLS